MKSYQKRTNGNYGFILKVERNLFQKKLVEKGIQ